MASPMVARARKLLRPGAPAPAPGLQVPDSSGNPQEMAESAGIPEQETHV